MGTPIAQGPKLRPKGAPLKELLPTKFRVETHQWAWLVVKKVLKITPRPGGGGGRPYARREGGKPYARGEEGGGRP